MKKITCFLTGGHRYFDVNAIVIKNVNQTYTIKNRCTKCGEVYEVTISAPLLISDILGVD